MGQLIIIAGFLLSIVAVAVVAPTLLAPIF